MDRMNQEAKNGVCDDYRRQIVEKVEEIGNQALLVKILSFIEAWLGE